MNRGTIGFESVPFPPTLITNFYFPLFNSVPKNNLLCRKKYWGAFAPFLTPPSQITPMICNVYPLLCMIVKQLILFSGKRFLKKLLQNDMVCISIQNKLMKALDTVRSGSSVVIVTGYGLDGLGIESRWGRDFPRLSRPALGPTQPPVQWVPGLSPGVKSGRGVTLTPHPLLVPLVMKAQSYTSTPPYGPYGLYRASVPVQGCTLPYLTFTLLDTVF